MTQCTHITDPLVAVQTAALAAPEIFGYLRSWIERWRPDRDNESYYGSSRCGPVSMAASDEAMHLIGLLRCRQWQCGRGEGGEPSPAALHRAWFILRDWGSSVEGAAMQRLEPPREEVLEVNSARRHTWRLFAELDAKMAPWLPLKDPDGEPCHKCGKPSGLPTGCCWAVCEDCE